MLYLGGIIMLQVAMDWFYEVFADISSHEILYQYKDKILDLILD